VKFAQFLRVHCRVTFNCCCGDFSATSWISLFESTGRSVLVVVIIAAGVETIG